MRPVKKIRLECANYLLRTMETADAALDWGGWLANPTTARLLNAAPRVLSVAEREAYIAAFDGRASHILGIWEKAGGALIGFWAIYIDETRREFLLNVLVGVAGARAKGAQNDTCDLIYEHFFDRLGMAAVRCTVSERNERMIDHLIRRRWTHVGSEEKPAADGMRPLVIHVFRLAREDWRARFEPGWREAEGDPTLGRKAG
jgi:RimJ/RimL family protein N-acetyltransferase